MAQAPWLGKSCSDLELTAMPTDPADPWALSTEFSYFRDTIHTPNSPVFTLHFTQSRILSDYFVLSLFDCIQKQQQQLWRRIPVIPVLER